MDTATQTIAIFTGTLLRREHAVGQKFVQLVFRENGQNRLCISSKLNHAKLTVGQNYQVEGVFKQIGDREYIHEPKITAAKRKGFPVKRVSIVASVMAGVLSIGGVTFAATRSNTPDAAPTTQNVARVVSETSAASTDTTEQATTPTDPAPTTPVTTPTSSSSAAKATKKASTPTTSTTSTTPTVQTPVSTAYCDAAVDIAVTYTDVESSAEPGTILTEGTPGKQQTCYDDASGTNPVTTVLTAMIPGTIAVVSTTP